MKIGGIDPTSLLNECILVLPRGDEQLVFRARGIEDMEEFEKLCPPPKPPGKLTKDGWVPNTEDENYKSVLALWSKKRMSYMAIKSLEPSQIEWDSVDPSNPRTWNNWDADLRQSGFSQMEIGRIMALVLEANCLDEEKLKKARDAFFRGLEPGPNPYSSPNTEPPSSPSGEPVSD